LALRACLTLRMDFTISGQISTGIEHIHHLNARGGERAAVPKGVGAVPLCLVGEDVEEAAVEVWLIQWLEVNSRESAQIAGGDPVRVEGGSDQVTSMPGANSIANAAGGFAKTGEEGSRIGGVDGAEESEGRLPLQDR
jgi:hypothetical protein